MTRAYERSCPTTVMSVPCSVVTTGSGPRLHDVLGRERRHRVGDRVVHVHEIKRHVLGDFRQARRQCEVVRRVLEQRIRRDRDLMQVDALVEAPKPRGRRVAEQVDLVSALSQPDRELGGDDARAAERRIANHAETKRPLRHR